MLPLAALSSAVDAVIVPLFRTPTFCFALGEDGSLTGSTVIVLPSAFCCSSITSSPATSPAVPEALIVPLLSTVLPISTTSPPSAVIVPRFVTPASPLPVKCSLPDMKSESAISRVLPVKPAVVMMPPGPTTMPLPLIR
jgi:hypothetical protein